MEIILKFCRTRSLDVNTILTRTTKTKQTNKKRDCYQYFNFFFYSFEIGLPKKRLNVRYEKFLFHI